MIKKTNDIILINSFLNYFNTSYSENPFRKYLVYDDKGILVYSQIYERIEVDYIFVKEEYRNKGIASELINYFLKKEEPDVSLEVKCDNIAAINLYKKFGFEIVATRENYYNGLDGYLMVRK